MIWFVLILAGLFEVGMAIMLKMSKGFSELWPSAGFVLFGLTSFYLLSQAVKELPVGTAYAVWTGIGAIGTATLGMLFFDEPSTLPRILSILLIIAGVVGLRLYGA